MPSLSPAESATALPDFLTDEQRAIITADCEHTLITAVAGSGKTFTLAWRIRYLLQQGHDPARMLVLMFNRSARADFRQRLQQVCAGTGLTLPQIRTYHSMGLRLYRRFIREGYLPAVSEQILTEQEIHYQVWLLLRRLAPEDLADDIRRNRKEYIETASRFIERVKATLSPPEEVFRAQGYSDRHGYLIDLFHSFEQWRKDSGRISYADMLYEPVLAIHQNPPLQRLVANRMDLLLVDEYQDTNEIQHLLLRYIAGDRARVTVVGDPDQTIYEFRGAQPQFILSRFSEEFSHPREQTLSYTFRYGHRVALLANHLIAHNRRRREVMALAHPSTPATEVRIHRSENHSAQVLAILKSLNRAQLSDTAILFRVWSQSVAIELKLLAQQIPYRIDAGKGALFSREADAIRALLTVAAGGLDALPESKRQHIARQLLRFPHTGLKETEQENLVRFLGRFREGWHERILAMDFQALPKPAARRLRKLGEALARLQSSHQSAAELIRNWIRDTDLFGNIRALAMTHDSADERIGTIAGFVHYLNGLGLQAPAALDHLQHLQQQAGHHSSSGVLLSTIHRTKGLEWSTVIIPGLQEKYLPWTPRPGDEDPDYLESERRLLYVAMTRARHALHLIAPPERGQPSADTGQSPSRFLRECQPELSLQLGDWLCRPPGERPGALQLSVPLTRISQHYARREGVILTGTPQPPEHNDTVPVWQCRRVRHVTWGPGTVLDSDERLFRVRFDQGDTKTFTRNHAHRYFAPLE